MIKLRYIPICLLLHYNDIAEAILIVCYVSNLHQKLDVEFFPFFKDMLRVSLKTCQNTYPRAEK